MGREQLTPDELADLKKEAIECHAGVARYANPRKDFPALEQASDSFWQSLRSKFGFSKAQIENACAAPIVTNIISGLSKSRSGTSSSNGLESFGHKTPTDTSEQNAAKAWRLALDMLSKSRLVCENCFR